jgi:hypothetical protein
VKPERHQEIGKADVGEYPDVRVIVEVPLIRISEIGLNHEQFSARTQDALDPGQRSEKLFTSQMLEQIARKDNVELLVPELAQLRTRLHVGYHAFSGEL